MVKVRFRVEIAIVLDLRYIWNNFRFKAYMDNFRFQVKIVIVRFQVKMVIVLGLK